MYDPDKKIGKLESWSNKDNDKISSLEELMIDIYHYERDKENSERIFRAIKLIYKIRKDIISVCKHNRSNSIETLQIIDNLINL